MAGSSANIMVKGPGRGKLLNLAAREQREEGAKESLSPVSHSQWPTSSNQVWPPRSLSATWVSPLMRAESSNHCLKVPPLNLTAFGNQGFNTRTLGDISDPSHNVHRAGGEWLKECLPGPPHPHTQGLSFRARAESLDRCVAFSVPRVSRVCLFN